MEGRGRGRGRGNSRNEGENEWNGKGSGRWRGGGGSERGKLRTSLATETREPLGSHERKGKEGGMGMGIPAGTARAGRRGREEGEKRAGVPRGKTRSKNRTCRMVWRWRRSPYPEQCPPHPPSE